VKTVPFCIGVALLLSGWTIIRLALGLRNLPPNQGAWSLFANARWVLPPMNVRPPRDEAATEPLLVHVWTPTGSAKDIRRRPMIDRYIAAVDGNGVVSTGHASLEYGNDVYVSHYPAVELDRSMNDVGRVLRAHESNDVRGRFQPSYAFESANWCEADALV
ncbi:protease, partial [Corallococcus exiguus]|uniref:hypothetical protein n=1 Tax=Corallococcus exiguus TaxID=83462 RepID=UPI0018198AEC